MYRTHNLRFGVLVQRGRNDQTVDDNPVEGRVNVGENWGGTSGDEFADILQEHFRSYQQGNAVLRGFYRFTTLEWYAQDSWKVTRNLTLEYGARWSWLRPWNEDHSQAATFDPKAYSSATIGDPYNGIRIADTKNAVCDHQATGSPFPLCGTVSSSIFPVAHPVTMPRIGFSWDTLGTAKFVLRGGVGQYTQRDQGNTVAFLVDSPPYTYAATLGASFNPSPYITLSDIQNTAFSSAAAAGLGASAFALDQKDTHIPAIYQYNLTISSNDLLKKTNLDVSYVGSQSRHLVVTHDINAVPLGAMWVRGTHTPQPGSNSAVDSFRPYLGFSTIKWIDHGGNSNYNSLQVLARRQTGRNLDLVVAYTYSKAMGLTDYYQQLVDPFVRRHSYTPLIYDRTHLLSLAYMYHLPELARGFLKDSAFARGAFNGWMLTGITRMSSGNPNKISTLVTCQSDTPGGTVCQRLNWADSVQSWFGSNAYTDAGFGIHPLFVSDAVNHNHGGSVNGTAWINPNAITLPALGQQGNFSEPYMKNPGLQKWDIALQKSFALSEQRQVQFRASAFNFTNRGQLGTPLNTATFNWVIPEAASDPSQGHAVLTNARELGKIGGKSGHRELEFALKFIF